MKRKTRKVRLNDEYGEVKLSVSFWLLRCESAMATERTKPFIIISFFFFFCYGCYKSTMNLGFFQDCSPLVPLLRVTSPTYDANWSSYFLQPNPAN